MSYPLVLELAADRIPVAATRRVLGFSRQSFFALRRYPVSQREWDNAHLINAAIDIHGGEPGFGYRFIADEIEAETGSIVYRSIARILAIEVDVRFGWNAVTAPMCPNDLDSPDWDLLRQFPTSLGAAENYIDRILASGEERVGTMFLQPFWAITRDLETDDSRCRRIRSHQDRSGRSDGPLSTERAQAHPDGQRHFRGVSLVVTFWIPDTKQQASRPI